MFSVLGFYGDLKSEQWDFQLLLLDIVLTRLVLLPLHVNIRISLSVPIICEVKFCLELDDSIA